MKSFVLILSLYVSCLAFNPLLSSIQALVQDECTTSCCLQTTDADTPYSSESPDDCCKDQICNPFDGCAGCIGFTLSYANQLSFQAPHWHFTLPIYEQSIPSAVYDAIWQPPEFKG